MVGGLFAGLFVQLEPVAAVVKHQVKRFPLSVRWRHLEKPIPVTVTVDTVRPDWYSTARPEIEGQGAKIVAVMLYPAVHRRCVPNNKVLAEAHALVPEVCEEHITFGADPDHTLGGELPKV